MALRKSLERSVLDAIQVYLATQVTNINVDSRWPDPDRRLPPRTVTVIRAGAFRELETEYKLLGSRPGSGNNQIFTWSIGYRELPFQMDIWDTSEDSIDDIIAQLDDAIHAPKSVTLAAYIAAFNSQFPPPTDLIPLVQPDVEQDVCLWLGAAPPAAPTAYQFVIANYGFEEQDVDDTPAGHGEREYRASFRGVATYDHTKDSTLGVLNSLLIRSFGSTSATPTATQAPEAGFTKQYAAISASGIKRSSGTIP